MTKGPKIFQKNLHFWPKNQKFLKKCHFFLKILLHKIIGGGRVAFHQNRGKGYFEPQPHPLIASMVSFLVVGQVNAPLGALETGLGLPTTCKLRLGLVKLCN